MKLDASPPSQMTLPFSLPPSPKAGREVIVFRHNTPPETTLSGRLDLTESPLKPFITDIDTRSISPREIQDLSLDLYAGGIITWEEHEDLAFQADLHPDFAQTIGALTGETALPNQPRDFVSEWEDRLGFEERYNPESPKHGRALRILSVLRRIDSPVNIHT